MKVQSICANPSCSKQFTTETHRVKNGNGKYCSSKCGHEDKSSTKYTHDVLEWVKLNVGKITTRDMSNHFGIKFDAFRRSMATYGISLSGNPMNRRTQKQKAYVMKVSKCMPTIRHSGKPNLLIPSDPQKIIIAEHSRKVTAVIRKDHKTYIIKH